MTITKTALAKAGLDAVSYGADWCDPSRYNGLYALPGDYGWRSVADAKGKPRTYTTAVGAERAALKAGAALAKGA